MKTVHRWLALIPSTAMLVLLISCAAYIPTDSTVGNMSVKEARLVFMNQKRTVGGRPVTQVRAKPDRLIFTDDRGKKFVFPYSDFSRDNKQAVDAIYVLRQSAIKQKKEVDEFEENFAASPADYRKKAASNAALPEEANKYKVQAEGAVRDKAFDDAADFYAEALKIAPWWPAGRFNRALVLGEAGDYEMAKREMKHYLQLVPDAPNARAAQNKIYEWERLESK